MVTFYSEAGNLVEGDTNAAGDVFVHDQQLGETRRVSITSLGRQNISRSMNVSISGDGSVVAFATLGSLVPDDTNVSWDVYSTVLEAPSS